MLNLLKKSSFFIAVAILVVLFLIVTRDASEEQVTMPELHAGSSSSENPFEQQPEVSQDTDTVAVVDIKGAIVSPGVYEVSADARLHDVILTAGGFTSDADQHQINLAQKVQDEMIIIVPKIGDDGDSGSNEGSVGSDGKIKVNMAAQEEIEQLPGIGPAKAQAIIQHREEHGLFNSIEDLLNVSGIGQKTLENMQDAIQIP